MPKATLVNPETGDRKAIETGSAEERDLFSKGYQLETSPPKQGTDFNSLTPQEQLNLTQLGQFGVQDALRNALAQRSPEFSFGREELQARFGDPKSSLYISNPFVRQAAIEKGLSARQQTFSTIADRLSNILGVQATRAGQAVEAENTALARAQQEFENQLALRKFGLQQAQFNRDSTPETIDVDPNTVATYVDAYFNGGIDDVSKDVPPEYQVAVLSGINAALAQEQQELLNAERQTQQVQPFRVPSPGEFIAGGRESEGAPSTGDVLKQLFDPRNQPGFLADQVSTFRRGFNRIFGNRN